MKLRLKKMHDMKGGYSLFALFPCTVVNNKCLMRVGRPPCDAERGRGGAMMSHAASSRLPSLPGVFVS